MKGKQILWVILWFLSIQVSSCLFGCCYGSKKKYESSLKLKEQTNNQIIDQNFYDANEEEIASLGVLDASLLDVPYYIGQPISEISFLLFNKETNQGMIIWAKSAIFRIQYNATRKRLACLLFHPTSADLFILHVISNVDIPIDFSYQNQHYVFERFTVPSLTKEDLMSWGKSGIDNITTSPVFFFLWKKITVVYQNSLHTEQKISASYEILDQKTVSVSNFQFMSKCIQSDETSVFLNKIADINLVEVRNVSYRKTYVENTESFDMVRIRNYINYLYQKTEMAHNTMEKFNQNNLIMQLLNYPFLFQTVIKYLDLQSFASLLSLNRSTYVYMNNIIMKTLLQPNEGIRSFEMAVKKYLQTLREEIFTVVLIDAKSSDAAEIDEHGNRTLEIFAIGIQDKTVIAKIVYEDKLHLQISYKHDQRKLRYSIILPILNDPLNKAVFSPSVFSGIFIPPSVEVEGTHYYFQKFEIRPEEKEAIIKSTNIGLSLVHFKHKNVFVLWQKLYVLYTNSRFPNDLCTAIISHDLHQFPKFAPFSAFIKGKLNFCQLKSK